MSTGTTTSSSSKVINDNNPHALNKAQDDNEMFEVMKPPSNDFDIFQDKPESTGQKKIRHLVHKDKDWHKSVHIWIVDPQRQMVVMQQRSNQKDTFPNRWDISAAGHIEFGQDAEETAIREVAEELGISISSSTTTKQQQGGGEEVEVVGEQKNRTTTKKDDHDDGGGLLFAFICPAEQASLGGCNCYEHVYFLIRDKDKCQFAIGQAEVTDVQWVTIQHLKQALEDHDENYVPRVEPYQKAFFQKLEVLCNNNGSF